MALDILVLQFRPICFPSEVRDTRQTAKKKGNSDLTETKEKRKKEIHERACCCG